VRIRACKLLICERARHGSTRKDTGVWLDPMYGMEVIYLTFENVFTHFSRAVHAISMHVRRFFNHTRLLIRAGVFTVL
jgi:hypothetical protein